MDQEMYTDYLMISLNIFPHLQLILLYLSQQINLQMSDKEQKNLQLLVEPTNQKSIEKQNQITRLQRILQKPFEIRTAGQIQYVNSFIKENIALTKLSEQISLQFVKNLLKNAAILFPKKNSIIYQKGDRIQQMGIVISGQLALFVQSQQTDGLALQLNNEQMFDKLLQSAKQFGKQLRKNKSINQINPKGKSSQCLFDKQYAKVQSGKIDYGNVESYINQNELVGFRDRSIGNSYTKKCLCLNDQTILLVFKQNSLMVHLEAAFKQKLKKMTSILKQISCFNFLDIDKINLIIQNLVLKRKKKFEYVYKQGDLSDHFYLLLQGQIKITKQTNLFEQNPNQLYGDRKKLIEQSLTSKTKQADKVQKIFIDRTVKKSILPYANLTTMYNYRPMKKLLEIGVITPPSLFGEEQYCQRKLRDTNTMCSSLDIQYYQIKINKLQEIIGNKFLPTFNSQLKNLVRKKLLYRQSQYANSINFENKNNLNYFYLQNGKQKQSPRKFKISKFNSIIQPKKASAPKKPESSPSNATFTAFNFHQMNNASKSERKQKTQDFDEPEQLKYEHNPVEMKIMDISHTWKLMKQKVDMQIKASKKISPIRPIINLKMPLIASEYFFHVEKESKRIDREHRKRIASLSNSFKLTSSKASKF